jgi:hypothetical protein
MQLTITNNTFEKLKIGVFLNMTKLMILNLAMNKLTYLPTRSFDGLPSLSTSGMDSTKIKNIEYEAFYDLNRMLGVLNLESLGIEVIQSFAFKGLANHTNLYIQKMPLVYWRTIYSMVCLV